MGYVPFDRSSSTASHDVNFITHGANLVRPKYYTPKNPYPTPSYYPQTPPPGLFENPAMFEKFDIDTLFFIFYYQQGTYQQ